MTFLYDNEIFEAMARSESDTGTSSFKIQCHQQGKFFIKTREPRSVKKNLKKLRYEAKPDPGRLAMEAFNCYLRGVLKGQEEKDISRACKGKLEIIKIT